MRELYAKDKESIKKRMRELHAKDKESIKKRKRELYAKDKESIKKRKRELYAKDKESIKKRKRKLYAKHREHRQKKKRELYNENIEPIRKKRRQSYDQKKRRNEIVGNFETLVSDIPCNTQLYEELPQPETGVMNWYQCVEDWRYEWPLETLLEMIESDDPDNEQRIKELTNSLVDRLLLEKITPTKQKQAAKQFYHALGKGCPWGIVSEYDPNCSIDARLLACACCGMQEFDGIDNPERTFKSISINMLGKLHLDKEQEAQYKRRLKIEVKLPIDEEGHTRIFYPWEVQSVYSPIRKKMMIRYIMMTTTFTCTQN